MDKYDRYQIYLWGMVIWIVFVVQFTSCGKKAVIHLETGVQPETDTVEESSQKQSGERENAGTETAAMELCVYVCGAVKDPGVYMLEPGSRVCDAIDAAGGLLSEASITYWNQAEQVYDGEMIEIPTAEEAKQLLESASQSIAAEGEDPATTDSRININTASKAELTELPGIGDTKAAAIISYRETHGNFTSIEDIMNVSGIKEGSFEKIKDLIRID